MTSWPGFKDMLHKRNPFVDVVYGRSACVGQDILKLRLQKTGENIRFINLQKGRLDLFFDWLSGKAHPKPSIIKPYILRHDLFGLIKQQEKLKWFNYPAPKYLFLDLYSELTDQKFTHRKEGWSFACHYSDIDHSGDFDQVFSSDGLLPKESFKFFYDKLFAWFNTSYPDRPIIVVHYSARYDERPEFKDRVECQRRALRELASNYSNLINLELADEDFLVFPYHYTDKTLVKSINLWSHLSGLTKGPDKL